MKFDVHGRFVIEVTRVGERWCAWRLGAAGLRRPERELVLPSELGVDELARFLDDVYHELATPTSEVIVLARG